MKKLLLIMPVISGILWGSTGTFVRVLTAYGVNSRTILFSRALFAAIILLIGVLIFDKSLLKIRLKDLWLFLGTGIVGMLGLNLCYNEAINRLTLSLAAVLLALSPIFVIFVSALLFKERITFQKIFCMCLAIFGCLLTSGILEGTDNIKWSTFGVVIGLCSAFFYCLYNVFSKVAMGRDYHAFTITFYSLVALVIVVLPFSDHQILIDFVQAAPLKHSVFILLHSVCTSVLPYILYTAALTRTDAGKASILASGGEPTAAMVFGILFFSEIPTALSLTGLVLTIIALSLLCRPAKKHPSPAP